MMLCLKDLIEAHIGRMYTLVEGEVVEPYFEILWPTKIVSYEVMWGTLKIAEIAINEAEAYAKLHLYMKPNPLFVKFSQTIKIDFHDPSSFPTLDLELKKRRKEAWKRLTWGDKIIWAYKSMKMFLR